MPSIVWFFVHPHFSLVGLQSQYEMSPQLCLRGSGSSLRMTAFIQLPAAPTLTRARNSSRHSCLDSLMLLLLSGLTCSALWIASSNWHLDIPPGSWFYFSFWHHPPFFTVSLCHTVVYSPTHSCFFRRRDDTLKRGRNLNFLSYAGMIWLLET